MAGIFISYRREDSAGHAGRLFDRLRERFGAEHVFMDVADIEPGMDFEVELDKALGVCDTVLVMIGRRWLDAAGPAGRRLDDEKDFVRLEVLSALRRSARVVPVLVGGATVPDAAQLPDPLKPLTRRQAVTLADDRWDSSTQDLLRAIDRRSADRDGGEADTAVLIDRRGAGRGGLLRRGWMPWFASAGVALAGVFGIDAWREWSSTVVVPSIVGQTPEQAATTLRDARLELGLSRRRTVAASAPDGVVLEQTPGAGAKSKAGTAVMTIVSRRAEAATPVRTALPALQFTPATLDFGARRVDTSGIESVTIANPAGAAMTVRDVQVAGGNAFAVAAGSCAGNTLVAGEQCAVDVYFVPRAAGRHEATLTLIDAEGRAHAGTRLAGDAAAGDAAGVEVPRLARLTYDQAFFALGKVGLAVGNVSLRVAGNVPSGMVLQQLTAAGSKVPPRTAIDFVVAVQSVNVADRTRGEAGAGGGTGTGAAASAPRPPGGGTRSPFGGAAPAPAAAPPTPAAKPAILHFAYDPLAAKLCYAVSGATRLRIEPAIGNVTPSLKACVDVKAADGARRYTLVASGAGGDTVRRSADLPH